ncbi:DNA-directed RNA polymerase III subunit RPC10 [Sparganum proliferum]
MQMSTTLLCDESPPHSGFEPRTTPARSDALDRSAPPGRSGVHKNNLYSGKGDPSLICKQFSISCDKNLPGILNSLSVGRDGPPTTNPEERSSLLMSATNKLDTDMSTRCDGCRELTTRVLKLEVDVDLLTEIIASLLKYNKIRPPEQDTKDMKNTNEPNHMNLKKPVKGSRRRVQRNKRQRTKSLDKSSDSTEMDGHSFYSLVSWLCTRVSFSAGRCSGSQSVEFCLLSIEESAHCYALNCTDPCCAYQWYVTSPFVEDHIPRADERLKLEEDAIFSAADAYSSSAQIEESNTDETVVIHPPSPNTEYNNPRIAANVN